MMPKFFAAAKLAGPLEFSLEDKLRVISFSAAGLLLTLRLDGWKAGNYETLIQIALLPYSLLFIFCVVVFLWPVLLKSLLGKVWPGLLARLENLNLARLVVGIALGFELITFGLLVLQSRVFEKYGYNLNLFLAVSLFILIMGGLGWFMFSPALSLEKFFYFVLAAYALVYLLSIISFPLNVGRSDMLQSITLGNQALLDGHNPYDPKYSTIAETGNYLNYFPANVLFYFPFDLLKLDLRLLNLICTLAIAFIINKAVPGQNKALLGGLLSLFLLNPFFQYRHEMYEIPEWLVLTLLMLCMRRQKPLLAGLIFGVGLALSPFNWVMLPFFLLYLFRAYNIKTSALAFSLVLVAGFLLALPFLVWSVSDFLESILGSFDKKSGVLFTPSVNLSYFLYQVIPLRFAKAVQGIVLLVVFYYAWKKMKSLADCFAWMTVALLLFIALNTYINAYFYFFIFFLMVSHRAAATYYRTKK